MTEQKEQAEALVNQIIDQTLGSAEYNEAEIENYSNSMPQRLVQELQNMNKHYKYCATCIIAKKNNTSMHVNSTCLWTPSQDCFLTVRWESPVLHCVVNIFAILI